MMLCAVCCFEGVAEGVQGEVDLTFGFATCCCWCCFLGRFRGRNSFSKLLGSREEVEADDGDNDEARVGMAMAQSSRTLVGVSSMTSCSRLGCSAVPVGKYSQGWGWGMDWV
jgi:hypothetical protein